MLPSARLSKCSRAAAVALLALAGAQCSVDQTPAPSLIGPSERALSTVVTATPDELPRDGVAQSTIAVVARGADAQPLAGQTFDVVVTPANVLLSTQQVVTGADGVAQFTITTLPPGSVAARNSIVVSVLPVGTNAAGDVLVNGNADVRSVTVRLLGPSNTTAPTAAFEITTVEADRSIGKTVTFDASMSTDEGEECLADCTYIWSFGDGSFGTGRVAAHAYSSAGTFPVTLTVRDASGAQDTATSFVTIAVGDPPTAEVVCSPSDPVAGQAVTCDAGGTTVEAGASVASYAWSWGDGNTSETADAVAAHPDGGYALAGTYSIRVTVTDNFGRASSETTEVEVGP